MKKQVFESFMILFMWIVNCLIRRMETLISQFNICIKTHEISYNRISFYFDILSGVQFYRNT